MPTADLNSYFNDFVLRQRSFYETVAFLAYIRNDHSKFLNLGYKGDVSKKVLPEDAGDEYAMNLYFKTLEWVEIKHIKSALEIGCGRGGGCYILKKYYKIADVTGIDMTYFNLMNAERNTKNYPVQFKHLNIIKEQLPGNKKYDLVLSVDTCQTYQNFNAFLKNIRKYMNVQSILAYSDFAFEADIESFKKIFAANHLAIIQYEDLTEQMCHSMSTGEAKEKKLPLWQRILLGKKLQRYLAWSSSDIDTLLNSKKLRYIKLLAKIS